MTLLYLVTAWIAGLFLASFTNNPPAVWLMLAAGATGLAYLARQVRRQRLTALIIALFALGAARYAGAARPLAENHIANYTGSYTTLTGIIAADVDVRDQHVNLRVQVETRQDKGESQSSEGLVLVQAPRYGEYAYGDRVQVSGVLLTPPEFDDFSYRDYLARRGIHAMIANAEVEILAHDQGSAWYAALYDLKTRAQRTIDRLLPSPEAPLLSGILLGVETGIADNIRDAFNRTGTSHVIAISGANIIVVIRVLMELLKPPLGTKRASAITVIGIGIYTLFVGADPAVVRAAIMGSITILAAQSGRQAYSPRARQTYGLNGLAASAWLMTAANPYTLWDIGFQLSVAATAGLVLFGDRLTNLLEGALRRGFAHTTARQITRWISEPVTVSLAAQITTTPLILLYFGRLSLVGLLANILIVSVQPYIMTIGGLATILGMIWITAGQFVAWIAWLPLAYTIAIVRQLSEFKFASVDVDFTASSAWIAYSALLMIGILARLHPEDRTLLWRSLRQRMTSVSLALLAVALTILVWLMAISQPDGKLHIWFLDVGQGHAVLIQTPNGAQILVDGGPNPTRLRSTIGDALPFWDRSLDVLIVTQPRNSAISALPALLEHYDIELALYNGQTADSDDYRALAEAWKKHDIDTVNVFAGYTVETNDGVTLEVLHPQTLPAAEDDENRVALVLRVSYGDTSFLLTPTLDEQAEANMLDAGWYAGSTVLELPAYGNDDANSSEFLAAINPQVGVVSVAAGNRSGLPDTNTIERLHTLTGQTLYRTDQHGTIEMVTDGQTLWIYPEH